MTTLHSAAPSPSPVVPDHEVVIVGAGFSGIGAAIKLKANGIDDIMILERAGEIGGTWRDNTYPGVAVDIPSLTYSFHFEPNPNWSRVFAPGHELQQYALDCVEKYDVRRHVRLNSEVEQAVFDEADDLWRLTLADGSEITGRFLISAHGALVTPLEPNIPGLSEYKGKVLRTQNWDHDYDLAGKKVAVIGTGATALQLIPTIAPVVERLDVYQRTPIWVLPKIDAVIPAPVRALFRRAPATQKAIRVANIAATESTAVLGFLYHKQLPFISKAFEGVSNAHRYVQVRDPELRDKLRPHYGFGCKRPSMSNEYNRTFARKDVALVTESIEEVTAHGVRTADGVHREVDALVLATGFKVLDIPYRLQGVGGLEMQELWESDRMQSYEGTTLPQFPNLFLSPGPYGATGYSWFANIELIATHAVRIIKAAHENGATRVSVDSEVYRKSLERTRNDVGHTIFPSVGCVGANSYYLDKHGDAPFARPTSWIEAWFAHHFVNRGNYVYTNNGSERRSASAVRRPALTLAPNGSS